MNKLDGDSVKKLRKIWNKEVEANENSSYRTGITWEDLSDEPDKYEGRKVYFDVKILQILDDDNGNLQYRVAVDDDTEQVMIVGVLKSMADNGKLEEDWATIEGKSVGHMFYINTEGDKVVVPGVVAERIN